MPRYDIRKSPREQKQEALQARQEMSLARQRARTEQQQANTSQQSSLLSQMAQMFQVANEAQMAPERLRELQASNRAKDFEFERAPELFDLQAAASRAGTAATEASTEGQRYSNQIAPEKFGLEKQQIESGLKLADIQRRAGEVNLRTAEMQDLVDMLSKMRSMPPATAIPGQNPAEAAATQRQLEEDIFSGRSPVGTMRQDRVVADKALQDAVMLDLQRDDSWFLDADKRAQVLKIFGLDRYNEMVRAALSGKVARIEEQNRSTPPIMPRSNPFSGATGLPAFNY